MHTLLTRMNNPINGEPDDVITPEIDSNCSTPYVSAPSSPGRMGPSGPSGYFFSAPASPIHYVLSVTKPLSPSPELLHSAGGSFEFGGGAARIDPMTSADELFLNGQIRPMKLQRPDPAEPDREMRLRSRSIHRRARSMSPMRNPDPDLDPKPEDDSDPTTESTSASRSSSSGRNSKRWIFLKDLLYRSKSEGRGREKEKESSKFWSSIKSPKPSPVPAKKQTGSTARPVRAPVRSAHERLYTANRAQAEEMRRRTFLPYRQGLLGCLGFSSRGYGVAVNGFAKTLNPVSSR